MAKKLPKPPKYETKHIERNLGVVVSVIIILILAFTVMFALSDAQQQDAQFTLDIKNFNFADSVDDDYNYEPNPEAVFQTDQDIFVYFEVHGFTSVDEEGVTKASLRSDLEVLDPGKNLVPQLSRDSIFDTDFIVNQDKGYIPIKTHMKVADHFPKGEYTFIQTIYDKRTGHAVRVSKQFTLR